MALFSMFCAIFCLFSTWPNTAAISETLYPESTEEEYTCGMEENCTIFCETRNSCYEQTFYVFNHPISFQCTGLDSCGSITIIANNVTTLHITATAEGALSNSDISINSTNSNVNILCDATNACVRSKFFYENQQSSTHICKGENACAGSVIHAVSVIEFHSRIYDAESGDSEDSSRDLDVTNLPLNVIWPTKTSFLQQSKWIHYATNFTQTDQILYLANTDTIPNITCINDCSSDSMHIQILYGTKFDQFCEYIGENTCLSSILAYNDDYDANTFHHRSYSEHTLDDTQTLHFSENTIVTMEPSLFDFLQFDSDADDTHLSILCINCAYTEFDFSAISSVAMTPIKAMSDCEISGPETLFQCNYNIFHLEFAGLTHNIYHLESTNSVIFNGLQQCSNDLAESSYIYLNRQTNVEINEAVIGQYSWCFVDESKMRDRVCDDGTIIYSSFGSNREVLQEHGWNLSLDDEDECILFKSTPAASTNNMLPIWAIITICVVFVVICIIAVLLWRKFKVGATQNKQIEKQEKISKLQPGSVEAISLEPIDRKATEDLNLDEDEENEKLKKEEAIDDDMKEGDGEDIEGGVYKRQVTDKYIAASATEANKVDTATASGDTGEGRDEVREWLESKVGLQEYHNNFVQNGMNSLKLISKIDDHHDLERLGIIMKGHQIAIMNAIKQLKKEQQSDEKEYDSNPAKLTPYESAARLEAVGVNENENQVVEQKEEVVLDNMLSEVLEMQVSDPDKIHQMNVDAGDQNQNESDSDDSNHMYQDKK